MTYFGVVEQHFSSCACSFNFLVSTSGGHSLSSRHRPVWFRDAGAPSPVPLVLGVAWSRLVFMQRTSLLKCHRYLRNCTNACGLSTRSLSDACLISSFLKVLRREPHLRFSSVGGIELLDIKCTGQMSGGRLVSQVAWSAALGFRLCS